MVLWVSKALWARWKQTPTEVMPEQRVFRSTRSSPSQFSVFKGPEMKAYPIPKTRMEWSSERRDLLEILEPGPQRFRPRTGSNSEVGLTLPTLPELPTPQREGLELIDRFRGYEYTLQTHIVPAAWPRSSPDVGYPPGCGIDGLRERRAFSGVREEMLEVKKRYLRGELSGGDERQHWVCVNRYVRNRLEEKGWEGRKRLTLFLTHGNGFGKEVSTAEDLTPSTFIDFFVVLGTSVVAFTGEHQRARPSHRRDMVVGRREPWGLRSSQQRKPELAL